MPFHAGPLAQLVERSSYERSVTGSTPVRTTYIFFNQYGILNKENTIVTYISKYNHQQSYILVFAYILL